MVSPLHSTITPPGSADTINRESIVPFYHQLKTILLQRISVDGLREGDRLWSENELCEMYGVARSVVRQAILELEQAGVVKRVKGKGTFLAPAKVDHGLTLSSEGLFERAQRLGVALTSVIVRQEVAIPPEPAARRLRLKPGEPAVVIERVRGVDGVTWAHTTSWVPASLAPGLEAIDLREDSLYRVLREKYGVKLAQADRSIEAVAADADMAAHLGVAPGSPLLRIMSVLHNPTGEPVETFVAHHPGDRSRFDVSVGPDAASAQVQIS